MKRGAERSADSRIEAEAAKWVARRDAGLTPADARELEGWLDADPRHRAALGFYDSAWSALAKPSRLGVGPEFEHQVNMLAIGRRRRRLIASGAVLAVVFAIISVAGYRVPWVSEPAGPTAVVLLPSRQVLPDGSMVERKGDTQITVDYTAAHRRVVLAQGEAYFSVQTDAARPFVVAAAGVEVRAVGTAFSVQMTNTIVQVLVTDGQVAVGKTAEPQPAGEVAPARIAMVDAGKRVIVATAPAVTTPEVSAVSKRDLEELLAWRSPRLEFTRTPLAEAVSLLNRHAPTSVQLAVPDPRLGAMRVSGIFRADNTEAFVLLLEGAFGVKAERYGDRIVLRSAE